MPGPAPKIDLRSYDDVVRQLRTLAQAYTSQDRDQDGRRRTGWGPPPDEVDAGEALIRIAGRLAAVIIDRLNRAPEKNFLAFLDLIGTRVHPPRAARVPLTFHLVEGSPADALVPARTQVAAPGTDGEEEVVFETDGDLVVTRARLVAVFAHDPRADRYAEVTEAAAGMAGGAFPAFAGTTPVEHSLYLARDEFLLLANPKRVTVTITSPAVSIAAALRALPIAWEVWTGTEWRRLSPAVGGAAHDCVVTFETLPALAPLALDGVEAGWLRARLMTPLLPGQVAPATVTSITMSVQVTRTNEVPARAFANAVPVDLSRDFYPLGEQPRLNDAFYLALSEEAAKPGATVSVHIAPSDPPPVSLKNSANLALTWEAWNGTAWQALAITESAPGAARFLVKGTVTATLPATLAPCAVNGESAYWTRARLTAGDYGRPVSAKATSQTDKDGKFLGVTVTMEGGYGPPSLASLRVSSTATQSGPAAVCLAYNAFAIVDCTAAARTGDSPFAPFTPGVETRPALYLGLDQPFDNRPVTIYLGVDPPRAGEVAAAVRRPAPRSSPRVRWEYGGSAEWRRLGAADGTGAFAESGELRFIGPPDLAARREFGQRRYWLRALWQDGEFLLSPRLRRLVLNTTGATQATTLQDEILGSSTGDADQSFRTTQAPVLLGQRLDVREPELPPGGEQAAIQSLEGDDAITLVRDQVGQPEEIWVRWHAVADFHASGPRDRHYVMDSLSGAVLFGDGQHGLVPPLGRDNIRMTLYRVSGGAKGNQAAETIIQLKTTVPYVESVVNLEPAWGGADLEEIERVKERGPKTLRHQGRAVTAQDFEDLAYEASPEVARAQALMPAFDPISLEWLPMWHLPLDGPGAIAVEVTWPDEARLALSISGPGRGNPVAQAEGQRQLRVAYVVPEQEFVPGGLWRVAIANRDAQAARSGQVTIGYPGGTIEAALDVPARAAYRPVNPIRQAGLVELIIVPRQPGPQPSPNLSLIARVREHLLTRGTPTLALMITEPDWVEVTISAEVVPVSPEEADLLHATLVTALERFLHPLTGGFDRQGWPFGRRPHLSDLYAVLESTPGLRFVRSLAVVNRPSLADIEPSQPGETVEDDLTVTRLPRDRRERFLIYSGRHVITMVAS